MLYISRPGINAPGGYLNICLPTWRPDQVLANWRWLDINCDGNGLATTIPVGNNSDVSDKDTNVIIHPCNFSRSPRWTPGNTSQAKRPFPLTGSKHLWCTSQIKWVLLQIWWVTFLSMGILYVLSHIVFCICCTAHLQGQIRPPACICQTFSDAAGNACPNIYYRYNHSQ